MRTLIAIVVLLIIGAVAYVAGTQYWPTNPGVTATSTNTQAGLHAREVNGYYEDPASWQTYQNTTGGWSIAYPIDFDVQETPVFILTIPRAFEPGTNFADARLTIEATSTGACAPAVATSSDAGAGNLYDTTTYRKLNGGKCYTLEYTIHSTQLANYPASYNLHAFDEVRVKSLLDRIVGTFKFL